MGDATDGAIQGLGEFPDGRLGFGFGDAPSLLSAAFDDFARTRGATRGPLHVVDDLAHGGVESFGNEIADAQRVRAFRFQCASGRRDRGVAEALGDRQGRAGMGIGAGGKSLRPASALRNEGNADGGFILVDVSADGEVNACDGVGREVPMGSCVVISHGFDQGKASFLEELVGFAIAASTNEMSMSTKCVLDEGQMRLDNGALLIAQNFERNGLAFSWMHGFRSVTLGLMNNDARSAGRVRMIAAPFNTLTYTEQEE